LTAFRPCIDLHQGKVKQIVGGSLSDSGTKANFVSDHRSDYYAELYKNIGLQGGHLISLGQNNQQSVLDALTAYPKGLQFGGGVNLDNALNYLNAGASKVIVTSYVFEGNQFSWGKLSNISALVGPENLVLDLSCRKTNQGWMVADVEGLQAGIDDDLVSALGKIVSIPTTYAGGATSLRDLDRVKELSADKVDLTIGSALDIFGGSGVTLDECVKWNQQNNA
jgi:phosphoribosylformimino-5-aminoimidazole carboxamide ribotide isomerase